MTNDSHQISGLEANRYVGELFEASGFSGFQFGTGFTLFFDRSMSNAHSKPCRLSLCVESRLRIGSSESWLRLVGRLAPKGAIVPDEPVFAYELARIRWSEGSGVRDVCIENNLLLIELESAEIIVVECATEEEDHAWTLTCDDLDENSSECLLVCEGDAISPKGLLLHESFTSAMRSYHYLAQPRPYQVVAKNCSDAQSLCPLGTIA